jgi:hypothetical protein
MVPGSGVAAAVSLGLSTHIANCWVLSNYPAELIAGHALVQTEQSGNEQQDQYRSEDHRNQSQVRVSCRAETTGRDKTRLTGVDQ